MLVLDKEGKIFDERRKNERRKNENEDVSKDRRKKDRRIEDINSPKKSK